MRMHTQYKYREDQKSLSELGNLMQGIFLSLGRMSTVKIRAGSLFCNPSVTDRAEMAGFRAGPRFFLIRPQRRSRLHRLYTGAEALALAGRPLARAKSVSSFFRGLFR
jgi:hypothetical protein